MKNVKKILGLAIVFSFCAFSVQAQQKATDKPADEVIQMLGKEGTFNLQEMAKAQDTVARLNYLVEIERKLSEIDAARKAREGGDATAPGIMAALPNSAPSQNLVDNGAYSVARVFGANGAYGAVLVSGVGNTIIVKQGDVLPNGAKVKSITMNGVRVHDNYGESNLPFSGQMGTSSLPTSANGSLLPMSSTSRP